MGNRAIRKAVEVLVAAVAVFAVMVSTGPAAMADHTLLLQTTDANPGGQAFFQRGANSSFFNACDLQSDGYRAVGRLYRWYGAWSLIARQDAAGGSGTCTPYEELLGLSSGVQLKMTVCLQNGYNGTPLFCNTGYYTMP
ncbi:MAG TPA: hypothetical protein VFV66_25335 [Nonomuraea sp.]|nr:hypothetical protein [Nonomuraea sp.]